MNNSEGPYKETEQMIINRLEEENLKLKEENKQLLNEILGLEKTVLYIEHTVGMCVNSLNSKSKPE